MALELARAFISVQVDKAKLRSEIAMARKEIIKGLSGIKVQVQVDAEAFAKSAKDAGKKAGAAAGKAAQQEANRYFGGFKVPPNAGSGFNVTGGLIRRPPLGPINVQQPGPRGLLPGPSSSVAHGPVTGRRIGGPVGHAGYQRRLGQTFVGGGGGPTYHMGGVPWGSGNTQSAWTRSQGVPRIAGPVGPSGYQKRLGQTFVGGGGGPTFHHGGVPWGASARVTPIGPGQLLIDGPTGPEGYQKRLGHTFNTGSGGPTFGQGGVPHGTGRGPRNPPPPSGPYGPTPPPGWANFGNGWGPIGGAPVTPRNPNANLFGGPLGGGGGRGGRGGGGRGGWLGMGGGRGYGGLMGGGVGSFLGGAGFAVAPMLTGISTFGGPAGTAGYLGARAVGASLGEFGDYEQSIRRAQVVQQNNGAGPDQLARMDAQARELGRTTVFSAQEAADAMVVLSQKGFDANEVYKQMPAILNLAAAGQIEISEAADIAASTMRQFGLEASDTTKIADVMTTAFLKSSAEVKDIGVALRYVGPMAKQAGYSLEQTIAGIMMLRNAGLTPSMAGTGLARLLGHMADPKKLEALAGAGVNVDNGSGGFRDLTDIIGQAGAAMSQMSELQAVGFSKDVFGFRGGPAFGALVQQGQAEAEQNLAELENATGASAKIAAHELENFNNQIKLFKDALSDLGITLGELAAVPATDALSLGKGVLSDLAEFIANLKKMFPEDNPEPKFKWQQDYVADRPGPAGDHRTRWQQAKEAMGNMPGPKLYKFFMGGNGANEKGYFSDLVDFARGGQNPEAEAESEKAFQEVLRLRKARKNRPLEEQNRRDAAGAALRNAAQQAINNRVFAPVVGTKALGRAGRLAAGAGMRGVLGGASGRGWRGAEWAQNALGTEVAPGGAPGAPDALGDLPPEEQALKNEEKVDQFAVGLSEQRDEQAARLSAAQAEFDAAIKQQSFEVGFQSGDETDFDRASRIGAARSRVRSARSALRDAQSGMMTDEQYQADISNYESNLAKYGPDFMDRVDEYGVKIRGENEDRKSAHESAKRSLGHALSQRQQEMESGTENPFTDGMVREGRKNFNASKSGILSEEEIQAKIEQFKQSEMSRMDQKKNFDSRSFGLEGMHSSIQQGVLRRREDETLKVQQSIEKGVNTTATNTGNLISAIKELNPGFA